MSHKSDTSWKSPQVVIAVIFLVCILIGLIVFGKNSNQKETHHHAGFKIYVDNQLRDFSAPEYMHIKPCGDTKPDLPIPQGRAHLHDGIGDVVHVHSTNATWGDLLTTLGLSLEDNALTFYLNGQKSPDATQVVIQPYDRVLMLVGENEATQNQLDSVPTREKIEQAEQKTENC